MRSYVPDFEMVVAGGLAEALVFVSKGFSPLSGGTDIMVLFNAGKLPVGPMVSIRRLPELNSISETAKFIEIGAAATYTQICENPLICAEFPLLAQSASWTGSIANQNRGTLGGNIANASPAADSSPVLLSYDAELKLSSLAGERWLPYTQFHLGYKSTALKHGELITSIRMKRNTRGWSHYGRKVGTRKAQAISKVSMAATASGHKDLRIALGSVARVPLRCSKTEEFLAGESLTPAVIERAKQVIREDISPIADIRSTAEYRTIVSQNLLGEFLESLL